MKTFFLTSKPVYGFMMEVGGFLSCSLFIQSTPVFFKRRTLMEVVHLKEIIKPVLVQPEV